MLGKTYRHRINHFIVLLLSLSFSACGVHADKQGAKTVPEVFIHPDVSVEAYLASSESGLSLKLQLTEPWALSVAMKDQQGKAAGAVDSCDGVLKASAARLAPSESSMFATYQYALGQCRAVLLASQLAIPSQSFLLGFTLGADTVHALPIKMIFEASATEKSKLIQQYKVIGDVAQVSLLNTISEHEVSYTLNNGQQNLKLLGRGDFNGDGIEDVILQVTNSLEGGAYQAVLVYALTRLSADASLLMLSVD